MLLAILTTLLCTKSSLSSLWKETTRATKVALAAQERRSRRADCPDVKRLVLRLR